jgi:hypothetical protein
LPNPGTGILGGRADGAGENKSNLEHQFHTSNLIYSPAEVNSFLNQIFKNEIKDRHENAEPNKRLSQGHKKVSGLFQSIHIFRSLFHWRSRG